MTQLPPTLLAQLGDRAEAEHLIDIGYRIVDSPMGPLLLVATESGLLRIAFAAQDHQQVLEDLTQQISPRVMQLPRRLDIAARQLDEFFAGTRRDFEISLDLQLTGGFYGTVQRALAHVGYGRTLTYTELAAAAGRPAAVRAAASACARNPLPLVLGCHRILRTDGSLGGYAGGLDAKRYLLNLEATRTRLAVPD